MITLVSDQNGIYTAQVLTKKFDLSRIVGATKTDWRILEHGPDHRYYGEVSSRVSEWSILDDNNKQFPMGWNEGAIVAWEDSDDEDADIEV
jgi:hypothetical protein